MSRREARIDDFLFDGNECSGGWVGLFRKKRHLVSWCGTQRTWFTFLLDRFLTAWFLGVYSDGSGVVEVATVGSDGSLNSLL